MMRSYKVVLTDFLVGLLTVGKRKNPFIDTKTKVYSKEMFIKNRCNFYVFLNYHYIVCQIVMPSVVILFRELCNSDSMESGTKLIFISTFHEFKWGTQFIRSRIG